jgi:putative phosphoribosyl transferase
LKAAAPHAVRRLAPARTLRAPARTEKPHEAGSWLAEILSRELPSSAVIAAIEPGGIALARAVGARLSMPVRVARAAPLTPPWNTQPVYGAVAFDGSVYLDDSLLEDLEITRREVERAVTDARGALACEEAARPPLELARRWAAIVDDGRTPAAAVTATAAALRNTGAAGVVVAIDARGRRTLRRLAL